MLAIDRMHLDQVDAAKAVIRAGTQEVFGTEPALFEDMDDVLGQYGPPSGTFLVLLDDGRVVGTGAVRRLDEHTCELKRMWLLPPYRGRGFGRAMAQRLLDFARSVGYQRARLDSARHLHAAISLYRRLGFYEIDRYNDGPGEIFMEKPLTGPDAP
jgi:putative acetyltransferase